MRHAKSLTLLSTLGIIIFSWPLLPERAAYAAEDIGDAPASPSTNVSLSSEESSQNEELAPTFKNPAQAAHAAQLADAAATIDNSETTEAAEAVDKASDALEKAMATGTPEEIEQAKADLAKAESAYTEAISALTGVVTQDISDMREAGMGWGNIAKELGVHPGVLGLGHTKGKQKNLAKSYGGTTEAGEIEEATARNTRSGYAKGHGLAMNTGVDNQTGTLGFGSKSKSRGTGLSGASGLGSGQGKAGNDGSRGGGNNGASSGPGNSGNNKGGAGVAGKDGSPGGGNSNAGGNGKGKDKGNKGKSGERGNK